MLIKRIFHYKKNISASAAGFTLIEMMVVMSIIAIMMTLSISSMYNANKQNQVLAAAREFQATVRQAANESITVTNAIGQTIPAKAWSVAVTDNDTYTGTYNLDSYHQAGDVETSLTKGSKTVTLQNSIMISVKVGDTDYGNAEVLNLIFSAPFAKFKAVKGSIGSSSTWGIDTKTKEASNSGTAVAGKATFTFSNGNFSIDVITDLETGETSI